MKIHPALLTAILWGICYTGTERIVKNIDIRAYLAISCGISTIIFSTWAYLSNVSISIDSTIKVTPWMLLSMLTSCLASYYSVTAVKESGASYASCIEVSYPVWVILFAYLLGSPHTMSFNAYIGAALVVVGTVVMLRN